MMSIHAEDGIEISLKKINHWGMEASWKVKGKQRIDPDGLP